MTALSTAPGVLGASITTYVTSSDVKKFLGCKDNKAYKAIRDVNKMAAEDGKLTYGSGKANKYLFAEKFGIPIEVVNAVIEKKYKGDVIQMAMYWTCPNGANHDLGEKCDCESPMQKMQEFFNKATRKNPRTGQYSFMLDTEEMHAQKNIS